MTAPTRSLKDLFLAAVEIASEDRRDWLDRECGADAELRERLDLMLAAHDTPQSLLDHPSQVPPIAGLVDPTGGAPTSNATSSEYVGGVIGPYKLLQQTGEGGMGVVYMAEQTEPVKRRVALKIIKPGMDSRQVIARFEAERQALTLMDHPNIAKVLDAGTTDTGRPYFVMELVKGQPITQYCDEHQLIPRQRLELLLPVCQAIQHAHQKGIIHRDIKPTNILVAEYDSQPVSKVIDFGVAKAISQSLTEKTMFTGLGQIVGTLEYMSPEQAKVNQLDIDTRSDIYSLGVLLYELLTGSTPFNKEQLRSAGWDEMLRIIREEEPPKPSTRLSESKDLLPSVSAQRQTEPARLTRLVRGELDWIVMKALEKDRNRRYETANGLAMDILRYLSDEPVVACPPSASYRFRKFARRNRTALVTTSLVAAALVVGLIASMWQAVRATRAEGLAMAEAERAGHEANRANREAGRANSEAQNAKSEAAIAQAVTDFLNKDLLAQSSPVNQPDRDITLRTLIDRATSNIGDRFGDQPLVEASIRTVLGETYQAMSDFKKAEEQHRQALEIRSQVLGLEHLYTGLSSGHLGLALLRLDRKAEAESLLRKAARINSRTWGPTDPGTLDSSANVGQAIAAQGRYAEAENFYCDLCDVSKRELGTEHPITLKCLNLFAINKGQQGNHEEAEKLFREVLEVRKRVLRPDHPQTLNTMNLLAKQIERRGRSAEAEKIIRELLAAQRRVLGPEHPATLASLKGLGDKIDGQSRSTDALQLFGELYETQRRVLGPAHADTLQNMNRLALEMARSGLHEKQERLLRDAIGDIAKLTDDSPHVPAYRELLADTQIRLGQLLAELKRPAEAEECYRQAISLLEKHAAESPAEPNFRNKIANTYNLLAVAIRSGRRLADAEQANRQAITIFEKLASEFPGGEVVGEGLGHSYRTLANNLDPTKKASEREQLYRQAATQFKELLDVDADSHRVPDRRFMLADCYRSLADALSEQKKTAEAEIVYRQALDQFALLAPETLMAPASDVAWRRRVLSLGYENLMSLLNMTGRSQEVAQVCERAIDLFAKLASQRPSVGYFRVELAKRESELAKLNGSGHWDALQHFTELYETHRSVLGPADPATFRSMELLAEEMIRRDLHPKREMLLREAIGDLTRLTEADPDIAAYRVRLADIQIRLGELLAFEQRPAEAEQTYLQAQSIFEKLAADFPTQPHYRSRIAESCNRLGHTIGGMRSADAEKAHRRAIAIYEKLAAEYPGGEFVGEGLGHAYGLLANTLDRTTKAVEREQLLRKAATEFEKLLRIDATSHRSPHRRVFLAASYLTLADAFSAQKRTAEAETMYHQSIDQLAQITVDALSRSEIDSAWRREVISRVFGDFTGLLVTAGRAQEAAEVCQKAINLHMKLAADWPDEPYFREELAKQQAELAKLKQNNESNN